MEKKCIVAGCLVIRDGKVLLQKHKKLGVWLPPGGHIEESEFPDEAAIRETKEETGLDVEIIYDDAVNYKEEGDYTLGNPFTIVYETVPYKAQATHIHFDLVYVAKVKGGDVDSRSEKEEVRWFTLKELDEIETFTTAKRVAAAALQKYGGSI